VAEGEARQGRTQPESATARRHLDVHTDATAIALRVCALFGNIVRFGGQDAGSEICT
jgi:hypothetical protein